MHQNRLHAHEKRSTIEFLLNRQASRFDILAEASFVLRGILMLSNPLPIIRKTSSYAQSVSQFAFC
jgi:hypothetical protein